MGDKTFLPRSCRTVSFASCGGNVEVAQRENNKQRRKEIRAGGVGGGGERERLRERDR